AIGKSPSQNKTFSVTLQNANKKRISFVRHPLFIVTEQPIRKTIGTLYYLFCSFFTVITAMH
ncbi:hypothetical protein HMPREF9075_00231, partial [Capnocytophaga sp. oral taxon 332 str. F0381]|uniref:hypothetical protein n=1 Tax=Capnocytophaga sp. oral taxon 332 TaxID=712213 RepID=UPI0002A343EE